MKTETYLKNIRKKGKRYFTLDQLASDLQISENAASVAVHRLKTSGDLISPARGLYIIVPPEHQPQGAIPAEELIPILMNHLKADYYVALLSAAMYHGAAHQKPGRFQIISNKRIKNALEFGRIKIDVIYKKSLAGLPTKNIVVNTGYLKIATPELVAQDLLLYPIRSGGLNHIATVLSELAEAMDPDKLIALAEMFPDKTWLQRLGCILEKIDTMDVEKTKTIIDRLASYLDGKIKKFIPLAPEAPRTSFPRSKKWMVIENTTIESDL